MIFMLALLITAFNLCSAHAQNLWHRETLTGNWGGTRGFLEEKGITFEGAYKSDVFSNISGGAQRGSTHLDNLDLKFTVDGEKMLGFKETTLFVYALGNSGGSPSEMTGDAQGIDNIDAPDTFKILEAWVEKSFSGGKLSVLAGLKDLNSEFYVTPSTAMFINSSHGIGPDFSQSGLNGPTIFPATSMGLRLKYQPDERYYFQTMVSDGVAGHPEFEKGTHVHFDDGEGSLVVAEAAYFTGVPENTGAPYGKYAIGAWTYTGKFDDLVDVDTTGNPVKRNGNDGLYLLLERQVLRKNSSPQQGLTVFARLGVADGKVNQFDSYLSGGVVYTGLIPGRDEDRLGFGAAAAYNGKGYKKAQINAGLDVDSFEANYELTYRAVITPWLVIQPDFQYIVNPGTDPSLEDAFVVGTRFEFSF